MYNNVLNRPRDGTGGGVNNFDSFHDVTAGCIAVFGRNSGHFTAGTELAALTIAEPTRGGARIFEAEHARSLRFVLGGLPDSGSTVADLYTGAVPRALHPRPTARHRAIDGGARSCQICLHRGVLPN
jgi:hypothetical protein